MKLKVNYRGAWINKKLKGNITRALKSYYTKGYLKLDEHTKLNIYVNNTAYPKYRVEAFVWETTEEFDKDGCRVQEEDKKYEITVFHLVRRETTNSIGQTLEEKILINSNKRY